MPQVTMPDGQVVEMPDKLDDATATRLKALRSEGPRKPHAPPVEITEPEKAPEINLKNVVGAAAEPALSMATGAIAQPVAGLAGLAQGAYNLFDPSGKPAGDRVRQIQEGMTYQPRTEGGKRAVETMSYPFQKVHEGGQAMGDFAESKGAPPWLSTLLASSPEAALTLLGAKGGKGGPSMLDRRLEGAQQRGWQAEAQRGALTDINERGAQHGLITEPSGGWRGATAGLMGKANIADTIAHETNMEKVTQAIKKEHGLDPDESITAEALDRKRDEYAAPYREVTSTKYPSKTVKESVPSKILGPDGKPVETTRTRTISGMQATPQFKQALKSDLDAMEVDLKRSPETYKFQRDAMKILRDYSKRESFNPKDVLMDIRVLRKQAKQNFRAADDPSKLALAFTQKAISEHLETLIEENATAAGKPQLAAKLAEARTKIAQTYDVEEALLPDGNLDMNKLRALSKRKPLSGAMKDVAEFAVANKRVMKNVQTKPPSTSFWDFSLVGGGLLTGEPTSGIGLAIARNLARASAEAAAKRGMLSQPPNFKPGAQYTAPVAAQQLARRTVPASIPGQLGAPPQQGQ
jgi:hypothetical protein